MLEGHAVNWDAINYAYEPNDGEEAGGTYWSSAEHLAGARAVLTARVTTRRDKAVGYCATGRSISSIARHCGVSFNTSRTDAWALVDAGRLTVNRSRHPMRFKT